MESKTILISGGTNGIGKAMVIDLLKKGHRVLTFSRSRERCETLKNELKAVADEKSFSVDVYDVNSREDMENIVRRTNELFGDIDVLINNAGFGVFSNADEMDFDTYEDMMRTNMLSLAHLTSLVVPQMKKNSKGLIINIASVAGKKVLPKGSFYSSTKFAVMGYSEGIREELRPFGIKVSTICPGMIKTDFFTPEDLERRAKANEGKVPTMLDPSDISRIITFIVEQSEVCSIEDITVRPML